MTKIPRYATSNQSLNSKTETTIKMNWSSDSTCSKVEYSTDNGSTYRNIWTGSATSGTYTIDKLSSNTSTNLSANTTYNIKTRVTRKDSGLTTVSSVLTVATYDYPHVTTTPNFKIGNEVYLTLYNPLKRNCTCIMYGDDWSTIYSGDGWTGTSIGNFATQSIINKLYASIPNKQVGTYHIKIRYNGVDKDKSNAGTYNTRGTEVPTFNDFIYTDSNTTTKALTGNGSIIVKGYSNVQVIIKDDNKGWANNYATLKSYKMQVGSMEPVTSNYSSTQDNVMTTNKANSATITVHAIDSRGYSKAVTKTATLKNYSDLIISKFLAQRSDGGIGNITTINFSGNYWNGNFGTTDNAIVNATYKYRNTNSSNWITGTTTLSVTQSNGNFNGTATINGDLGTEGFTNTESFYIQLSVQDKLVTKTVQLTLKSGTPAIAIYNNKVAVGGQYDTTRGGILQASGDMHFMGSSDSINWKEVGYGDKFRIIPSFGGADDSNLLKVQGTVGGAGEDPTDWKDLFTISAKSGKVKVAGNLSVFSMTRNSTDTWIPVINDGEFQYTTRYMPNTKTHSQYNTEQDRLATLNMLSWWNGAYNSGNNSNLTYCHQGTIQAKPISLYDNSSGSNGSITLSQSAANFTYLEIYYRSNDSVFSCTKVFSPNGKTASLIVSFPYSSNIAYQKNKSIKINGTSITNVAYSETWIDASGKCDASNSNNIHITKVVGYK